MPFQMSAPQRFMGAQKPKMAAEMQAKTPVNAAMPAKAAPAAKPMSAPTPERKKLAMQSMVAKYGK